MSRCYPFPPPGYLRKETQDESLIKSIKGAKEEVKRDRKHKNDKKRKERDNESDRSRNHRHHKRRHKDESVNSSKKVYNGRGLVTSNGLECLEKSCLTVELEHHQTSPQTSCDSTFYSKERPNGTIQSPILLDGRQYGSETGLRILLRGQEKKYPDDEVMLTSKDRKQFSSHDSLDASQTAPSESLGHTFADDAPLKVYQEKKRTEITTKLSKDKKTVPLESDRRISKPLGEETHQENIRVLKVCSKCPSSMAVQFLNLIENWAPDLVNSKLTDSEDQELWLVMKVGDKRHHHHQVSSQTTINGSSSMVWPTAQFLPEAELHALPFTVPF